MSGMNGASNTFHLQVVGATTVHNFGICETCSAPWCEEGHFATYVFHEDEIEQRLEASLAVCKRCDIEWELDLNEVSDLAAS